MKISQLQFDNSEPVLKITHNIITWFSEQKEMFETIFSNNNKIENYSMAYDLTRYNKQRVFDRKIFLWLSIILEGLYSKTIAYYFLHIKAGIPYDLISQMWAIDYAVGFMIALFITKGCVIGVRYGLEKYREQGGIGTKYHIFSFLFLTIIPIVNISYKLNSAPSNNIALTIIIPILLFLTTSFSVYLYVDRDIKHGERDIELKRVLKKKQAMEIANDNMFRKCKENKKEIQQEASKLSILFSKVSSEEVKHFTSMFPKVERYIIHDLLFNTKPVNLILDGKGEVEDLSENSFVKFFMKL